jgi:tRNA threonylcarbamoyladenosine biosynthesis protein TsaB
MILLLDTSTPICRLTLIDGNHKYDSEWQADRTLARDLLAYLRDQLKTHNKTFADVSAIGVFRGPGSFTGLRIGLTVLNTFADAQHIPIVGGIGDDWQAEVRRKIEQGDDEKIVMPFYGGDAHITKPRK